MVCSWSHMSSFDHGSAVSNFWDLHKHVLIGGAVLGLSVHVYRRYRRQQLRNKWDAAPKDMIILHCGGRGAAVPNISPFVLKLETFLRMADLKYELDTEQPFGAKGKFPWITLNGSDYDDSELIIEMLSEKFNKGFSSQLSLEEKGVSRSMAVMTDEHLFLGVVWWRVMKDFDFFLRQNRIPYVAKLILPRIVRKRLWMQGIGRHTDEEIMSMMRNDLAALSGYLGSKPFMMGGEPSEVDCSVFGLLAQIMWTSDSSPFKASLDGEFSNLKEYCLRMKERFWSDWDARLIVV